jgi:plastocyanin
MNNLARTVVGALSIGALVVATTLATIALSGGVKDDVPPASTVDTTGATTSSTAPEPGTTTPTPGSSTPVALVGGIPGFDIETVAWNGYWYSRYNLGNIVMMSGVGVPFAPPMEAVMAMVAAVDQGAANGEHVMLPENPALLRAVFAGGDPTFVNPFNGNPGDFTNWRWDPEKMDTRIVPAAQAQTIIKEVEWAKLFNNGGWAGGVTADFGAMDRFKGMAMFAGAKMQTQFALQNLRNEEGLFASESRYEDGTVTQVRPEANLADQYQMLQALSDVAIVLREPELFNGVYRDDDFLAMLAPAVDELFESIVDLEPETILELDLGTQAFVWFAVATDDSGLRSAAMDRLEEFGDALVDAPREGVVDRARAIRGLIESARILGIRNHLEAALDDFAALDDAYDGATGSFDGVSTLSTWDVGDIIGALNTLRFNAIPDVDRASVEQMLVGFFEATVNRGGLMRAVIPKEMEASPFEIELLDNDLYFAYPGIPTPGEAGVAAVDVAEVSFDRTSGQWAVADAGFVTSATMHASNEMFWVWGFQSGFPTVPGTPGLEHSGDQPTAGDATVIEVVSSEFAFSPVELNFQPGQTVTLRLRNDGQILHNIEITELGVFVEAAAGQTAEVTFTVPDATAQLAFFCNIPGHRQFGMEGATNISIG